MGFKTDFLSELNADLPDGVGGLLDKAIPEAPSVAMPTDVDSAIIAQGVLAKYLLDLLDTFRGLTPVELLLRIGQKNATLQAALLAGLEYVEKKSYEYTILSPTTEGIYYEETEIQFSVEFESAEGAGACSGVAVSLVELGQNFTLDRVVDQPAFMKNVLPDLPEVVEFPLSVVCRFTATFEEAEPYTKTVSIEIQAPV